MKHILISTPADVLETLKGYRDELQNPPIRKPSWPLIERLLTRETEMKSVWKDIARYGLTWQQCHSLLEQIVFAGQYGTDEAVMRLKADYSALQNLNSTIAQLAQQLAEKLDAREHILNRNNFILDNTVHIVDLIDKAAAGNGHYRSRVREPLQALSNWELKYWPSIQAILQTIAQEPMETGFMDEGDMEIVCARGELVPDYLRELFSCILSARESFWGLPHGFKLTDASLATLATVSLDLKEPASISAVKMHRTRLSKRGFPGAWPVRKKEHEAEKSQ